MRNLKRRKSDRSIKFKYSEIECPICMDTMSLESRSVTAPCMHEFCLGCIGKWLMESSSQLCPMCKQAVKKIMYKIEDKQTYSIVGFPDDFCAGWTVRNKMKSIFDDFDNVLRKIYGFIKNIFEKDRSCIDAQILSYLVWFADVKVRVKSRLTEDEVHLTSSLSDNFEKTVIKDLLTERLNMLFKLHITTKLINEIYKKDSDLLTINDILLFLDDLIDTEKVEILRRELECHVLISRPGQSSLYIEYYIPLQQCCDNLVLYSDNRLRDDKILSALVTKVLCSFTFIYSEDRLLLAHASKIHELCYSFDYSASYDKLLDFMSEACYFIMQSNPFYKNSKLKKKKQIQSSLISNKAYNLVKHCFKEEEFCYLSQAQKCFDKQYIYTEPVIVEDSSSEDESVDELNKDDNVQLIGVYLELSDSDDDALQVLSIQPPMYDLTNDSLILEESTSPLEKRKKIVNFDTLSSLDELSELSTIGIHDLSCESSFGAFEDIKPSTSYNEIFDEELITEVFDIESNSSDCVITEEVQNNRLSVNFIYEPYSTEDFYQYLLSEENTGL